MSPKFEKVKRYFDRGIWTAPMVYNAIKKGWITHEEYNAIVDTGEGGADGHAGDHAGDV